MVTSVAWHSIAIVKKRDAARAKKLAAARKRAEQYNQTHPKKKK